MNSTRYTVDLTAYMAESEANYARLAKLTPPRQDSFRYHLSLPNGEVANVDFHVTQRCKFTTMITLDLEGAGAAQNCSWLVNSKFDLHVYHDAKMVDVVGFQRNRGIQPVYKYPNRKMYQKDEKHQLQRFLSECLANCLVNGMCISEQEIA